MGVKRNVRRLLVCAAMLPVAALTIQCSSDQITSPEGPQAPQRSLGAAVLDGPNPYAGRPLTLYGHDGFPTDIDFEIKDWGCVESVTEEYAGAGVHFSNGTVAAGSNDCLNTGGFPPHSPIHIILDVSDGSFDMSFDFTTDAVGLRYITSSTLTLSCFTAGDVLVDSASAPASNVGGPHGVLVAEGEGIRKCTVTGPANGYIVDDLFFGEGGGGPGPISCRPGILAAGPTIAQALVFFTFGNPSFVNLQELSRLINQFLVAVASLSDEELASLFTSQSFFFLRALAAGVPGIGSALVDFLDQAAEACT